MAQEFIEAKEYLIFVREEFFSEDDFLCVYFLTRQILKKLKNCLARFSIACNEAELDHVGIAMSNEFFSLWLIFSHAAGLW